MRWSFPVRSLSPPSVLPPPRLADAPLAHLKPSRAASNRNDWPDSPCAVVARRRRRIWASSLVGARMACRALRRM